MMSQQNGYPHRIIDTRHLRNTGDVSRRYSSSGERHTIDARSNKDNHSINCISRRKSISTIENSVFKQPSYRTEELYDSDLDLSKYLDRSQTTCSTALATKSLDFDVGVGGKSKIQKAHTWHFPLRRKQNIKTKVIEVSGDLVPGEHSPHVEAQIVNKMKNIALTKATQGFWLESYAVLRKIYDCEKVSLQGGDHPKVANTLFHMGVALYNLGKYEKSLDCLEKGLRILYPRRYLDKNLDLAAIYYQKGVVKAKLGELTSACNSLDLCRQVEEHILGHATERTKLKEEELKSFIRHSQRILRRSSF